MPVVQKVPCQALRGPQQESDTLLQVLWGARCYTKNLMTIRGVLSGRRPRYKCFRSPEVRVDTSPSPYLLHSPVFMEAEELPGGKVKNCKRGFEIHKHVGTKK